MLNTLLIIDKVLQLAQLGLVGMEKLKQVQAQVEAIKAEGRDPTDAEWASINARLDSADAILEDRAAAARKALQS